jgi:arabinan endo-1,5-alpha-L-arabinosidase
VSNATTIITIALASLSVHFSEMLPPMQPDDWTMHDPSRVVEIEGMQMVAVSGKRVARGYACGLETWYRTDSSDEWQPGQCLLMDKPYWIDRKVPGNQGRFRSPGFLDERTMYYSIQARFEGLEGSCIGLLRAEGQAPDLRWRDHREPVLCTYGESERELESGLPLAIAPAPFRDSSGDSYLVFGGGNIVLTRLDEDGLPVSGPKWSQDDENYKLLARRAQHDILGNRWVDAPYIHQRNGQYFLFLNYYACCRGLNSTYQIMVGRSNRIEGPYVDKQGRRLLDGFATLVMTGYGDQAGPGHAGIWKDSAGQDWLTYHYYDARRNGMPWIGEKKLSWIDGWPVVLP